MAEVFSVSESLPLALIADKAGEFPFMYVYISSISQKTYKRAEQLCCVWCGKTAVPDICPVRYFLFKDSYS